jgi:nucleotide-binding universal stress UspA family protein
MSASRTHPIVVGVDSSAVSFDAVRWAADEASRCELPLTLVHAGYYLYEPALSEATASVPRRGATASQLSQASEMGRQQPGARSSATWSRPHLVPVVAL